MSCFKLRQRPNQQGSIARNDMVLISPYFHEAWTETTLLKFRLRGLHSALWNLAKVKTRLGNRVFFQKHGWRANLF